MPMKTNPIITGIAAAFTLVGLTASAHAQLIASESFWTTANSTNGTAADSTTPDNQYWGGTTQQSIGRTSAPANNAVVAGNSGFNATNTWQNNTGTNLVTANTSLTHSGLVGGSQVGSLIVQSLSSGQGNRNSHRLLAAAPTAASSYFMSALIQGSSTVSANGSAATVGFIPSSTAPASSVFTISTGFHMGLHAEGGILKIAAFANGQTYNLLNLANTDTYQVVLRLDVNASGNETLTAWYAANNATSLTQALVPTDIGTFWSTSADLQRFVLQNRGAGDTTEQVGFFDEMRFGTTLGAVTAIPEPSAFALLATSLSALVFLRRRRT